MDEILIEEKKYVSSKRAAKMTGYAKDYIGQLCREGRVPARLIGRSWYVLESAIQDHRFGDSEIEPKEAIKTTPPASIIPQTWESPRYEAVSDEPLPPLNTVKNTESVDESTLNDTVEGDPEASQRVQDSWKEWFDRFDQTEVTSEQEQVVSVPEESEKEIIEEEEPEKEEDTRVNVPIHAIVTPFTSYQPPPEELLPRRSPVKLPEEALKQTTSNNRRVVRTIQIAGILLATAMVVVAIIGTGYFDGSILANNQMRAIAGVSLYNK